MSVGPQSVRANLLAYYKEGQRESVSGVISVALALARSLDLAYHRRRQRRLLAPLPPINAVVDPCRRRRRRLVSAQSEKVEGKT